MTSAFGAARARSTWAGVLLLLAACGAPEAQDPSPGPQFQRAAIINGHTDTADTAVAALYVEQQDGSGYLCSGSIIGPHTFLTAAHCAQPFVRGSLGVVVPATDANAALQAANYVHVDVMQANPGYKPSDINGQQWNDIGIAHLVEAVPGPYMPINRYPLDRLVLLAKPVREVGYGITSGNADGGMGDGERRSVTKYDLQVINAGEIESGDQNGLTCEGDSGGPAVFVTPDGLSTCIGVTSRGDQDCRANGIDTRIEPYLDWIAGFMAAHGDTPSCGADGVCGFNCTAPDPDCPCAPDGFCTSACATPEADPDCPQSCLYDGGTCIPPAPPAPKPADPAPKKSGCQGVDGLSMLALVTALSPLVRKRRRGPGGMRAR